MKEEDKEKIFRKFLGLRDEFMKDTSSPVDIVDIAKIFTAKDSDTVKEILKKYHK